VTTRPDGLHLPALRELGELRQRNLVRRWLRRLNLPVPDARQLARLLHDALMAGHDRQPWTRWPGGEVRRYRDVLYAMPPLPVHDPRRSFVWRPVAGQWPPLDLPGIGGLQWRATVGAGLSATALTDAALTVRFRQGGERFQPAGRRHSQELKKLLQEAGIPPWERERLPLLYREEKLLAVVGLGVAAELAVAPDELGWQPVLAPLPATETAAE